MLGDLNLDHDQKNDNGRALNDKQIRAFMEGQQFKQIITDENIVQSRKVTSEV